MKIVSTAEMIAFERAEIDRGVSAADLMLRAGEKMTRLIQREYPAARTALVVVGKGNNGGDGLVVARLLSARGWNVRVLIPGGEPVLRELPRRQLERLRAEQPAVLIHTQWHDALLPDANGVVIDALLGVGAAGPLREEIAVLTNQINRGREKHFYRTVALDLPTGLPGDSPRAIVADLTLTVGWVKDFLVREDFSKWVGRLLTVPLFADTLGAKETLLTAESLAPLLPRRSAYSHKNTYGRAIVVGGSPGFTGAPVLAARSALRTGAGLVNLVVAPAIYPVIAAMAPPEVMVSEWKQDKKSAEKLENAKSIAIGPGLGTGQKAIRVLASILKHASVPVVVDADALTCLSAQPSLFKQTRAPLIVTPHPGEMRRLIGKEFSPAERPAVAAELSRRYNIVVVLKGTRTIVAVPGEPLAYNSTGNPGLAVGGSGDTLTGILVGLLAQGLPPGEAARLGVWLHGRAADLALRERGCEEGLLPGDVCQSIGRAMVDLRLGD